ncbi:ABC transporter permease subunit [Roseinatronobacter sp. S2]|uniref:ABC transporter permease subunit n=1 Tax=Roseinatronobacter sp. S2 TaxID=3035471 RepID=UPI0024104AEB|nr:ABC transporter permease subunit [Roseinatronobacter sp. S2]WFE76603.1 ABC transporter permease subunit [Roseinatronobacter sp. S2]
MPATGYVPFNASPADWLASLALPVTAIVLLAFYQALGASIYLSMIVFGIMLSPSFFRLTRNLVIGVKHELYIDAARVSGLSDLRIIVRHVLRVIRAPLAQAGFPDGLSVTMPALASMANINPVIEQHLPKSVWRFNGRPLRRT